jgi:hypothetical protein
MAIALGDRDLQVRIAASRALEISAWRGVIIADAFEPLGNAFRDKHMPVQLSSANAVGYAAVNEVTNQQAVSIMLNRFDVGGEADRLNVMRSFGTALSWESRICKSCGEIEGFDVQSHGRAYLEMIAPIEAFLLDARSDPVKVGLFAQIMGYAASNIVTRDAAIELLVRNILHDDGSVRRAVSEAMKKASRRWVDLKGYFDRITPAFSDSDYSIRRNLFYSLMHDAYLTESIVYAHQELMTGLSDPDSLVRVYCARALGYSAQNGSADALILRQLQSRLTLEEDPMVRVYISLAIKDAEDLGNPNPREERAKHFILIPPLP